VAAALPFLDADALTGKTALKSIFFRRQFFARITARDDGSCNFYRNLRIFDERVVVNGLLSAH
jgi:hypothetical protein